LKLEVRLFAVARQLAGTDTIVVELPAGATVAMLRKQLAEQVPALEPVLPHVLFAVGNQYAGEQTLLSDGAEVACIPPVSGG